MAVRRPVYGTQTSVGLVSETGEGRGQMIPFAASKEKNEIKPDHHESLCDLRPPESRPLREEAPQLADPGLVLVGEGAGLLRRHHEHAGRAAAQHEAAAAGW